MTTESLVTTGPAQEVGQPPALSGGPPTGAVRAAQIAAAIASGELPETKDCTVCGETKPRAAYYLDWRRRGDQWFVRLRSECNTCFRARSNAQQRKQRDDHRNGRVEIVAKGRPNGPPRPTGALLRQPTTKGPKPDKRMVVPEDALLPESKSCSVCGETKPREDFGAEWRTWSGARQRILRADCRACQALRAHNRRVGLPPPIPVAGRLHTKPRHTTTPPATPAPAPQEESVPVGLSSSGENRVENKSVLGFHMDAGYKSRLARWSSLLGVAGVFTEYQFLSTGDAGLRAIDGMTDEALRTIRRAISHNDEAILTIVFPPETQPAPPKRMLSRAERLARQAERPTDWRGVPLPPGPETEPELPPLPDLERVEYELGPELVDAAPAHAPVPTELLEPGEYVRQDDENATLIDVLPPEPFREPTWEEVLAASRLIVEVDGREERLRTTLRQLEEQLAEAQRHLEAVAAERHEAVRLWRATGRPT